MCSVLRLSFPAGSCGGCWTEAAGKDQCIINLLLASHCMGLYDHTGMFLHRSATAKAPLTTGHRQATQPARRGNPPTLT